MPNKMYALHKVKPVKKIFDSADGSHNTVAAYEFEKGELISNQSIGEDTATLLNTQSHNSYIRYYELDEAEIAAQSEAAKPKAKKK